MSPEQARGENAQKVSDVWAFGCVLYELLTGRRVFEGKTVGEILAGVFKVEPDWHRLPAETPDGIRRLLRRCLQKDQNLRFRDIRDARLEIDEVQTGPPSDGVVAPAGSRRREPFLWTALVLVTLIGIAGTVCALRTARRAPDTLVDDNTPPSV